MKRSIPKKEDFNGDQNENSSQSPQRDIEVFEKDDEETNEAAIKLPVHDLKPIGAHDMIQIDKEINDRKTSISSDRLGNSISALKQF